MASIEPVSADAVNSPSEDEPSRSRGLSKGPLRRATCSRGRHNFIPSGCINAGYNGGNNKELQAVQQAMQPKYEALFKRIEADPRIAKIALEWSTCMRKKGHEGLKSEREIYEKVLNPLQSKIFSSQSELPAPSPDTPPGPPKIDEKKLAELRKVELALANDDADCSTNTAKVRKTVTAEYSTAFLEQNRANLEKIKAAQEVP